MAQPMPPAIEALPACREATRLGDRGIPTTTRATKTQRVMVRNLKFPMYQRKSGGMVHPFNKATGQEVPNVQKEERRDGTFLHIRLEYRKFLMHPRRSDRPVAPVYVVKHHYSIWQLDPTQEILLQWVN